MKLPNLPKLNPKTNLAVVATSFLLGFTVYSATGPNAPKSQQLNDQKTASLSQTQTPTTSDTTTSSPSTAAPGTPAPTSTTSTDTSGTTQTTQTTQQTVQDPAPPPVTVVSVSVGAWQDTNVSQGFIGGPNNGRSYVVQDNSCTYTYSDASQKTVPYQNRYYWNDGSSSNVTTVSACTLENAPSSN